MLKYYETVIATPVILTNLSSYLQLPTSIDNAIFDCYKISNSHWWENKAAVIEEHVPGVKDLLLSPRSVYVDQNHPSQARLLQLSGLLCCQSCLLGFHKEQLPKFSIANGYFVGSPPPRLTELNDVELALLTPAKTFRYRFSYTGGKNMKLKRNLAYYKGEV